MSIVTRCIQFMSHKACLPQKIIQISLDEKKGAVLGEDLFDQKLSKWNAVELNQKALEVLQSTSNAFELPYMLDGMQLNNILSSYKNKDNINCPKQYYINQDDLYIVTEYLEPLEQIQKYETFTEEDIIQIGMQLAKGLDYVPFIGITPECIGRSKDGSYKLEIQDWDFKYDKYDIKHKGYSAKEELEKNQHDVRSDIYRLGLILYELCNHNKRVISLKKIDTIGVDFFAVLQKACANEPQNRYQTATQFYEALRMCLTSEKEKQAKKYLEEGKKYYYGTGVTKDYKKAFELYMQAAKLENADACNRIGVMYRTGEYVSQNNKEAMKWYRMSAEKGNQYAQSNLGWFYYNGVEVEKDYKTALYWYQKSAEQGNAGAQNQMGSCYYIGYGVEKNFIEAKKWYEKSSAQGNQDATFNLGLVYYYGDDSIKDMKKAFDLWKTLAEKDYLSAMKKIAWMYYYGNGTEQNYKEAFKWYEKLAEKNDGEAYNYLGVMYDTGKGVEKNIEKAIDYYRKSAEQGDSYGMNNLGVMYYYGKGVTKDLKLAKQWYEKSAEKGNPHAKKALEKFEK